MPRFEKGSQEAKDYMAKIRNARKQPDYVPPANKKLTKKQREMEELKKVKVDIPVMGKTSLIVPEYFAVPRKGRFGAMKYKLVNPMSQERNLSSRGGEKSLKIIRKPVGDMTLIMEDGSEAPLPLLAFSKADQKLIQGISKMVEANKDKDPADVRPLGRPKPVERGRPEKLPKNVAVHKQRKTKPGWSKKQTKKQQEDDGENIQMTMEEEPVPTTAYQRKQRQTYASEAERKEAVKKQKRDYAQRKRDKLKAEGSGLLGDIKKGIQSGIKKTGEYVGAVVYGRGNIYPPKVRGIIKKLGEQKVVAAELRRSPVQSLLTKAMDLFTFGQFSKNMSQTPYDKLFHLQIILTLDNGVKLLVEKNEVINMDIGSPPIKKGTEVLPVSPFSGDVLNNVLEKTKTKMGDKAYFDYNAENNNCQDFISSLLSANGWGDANDFAFVKQDTKSLFKGLSGLAKTAYTLTELGERANVAMTGRGNAAATSAENRLHYRLNDREFLVVEIHQLQRRMDAIMTGGGSMEDRIRRIMELNGEMEQLVNRLAQLNNVIGELQNQLMNNQVQEEDEGDTESESSMEGEGIAEWIRTKLGVKQGVKPADYRERLDKMITIAKAEQQKAFIDQRRRDKGLPPLKPKPIDRVAPAPVYNDMIFDDSGELVEGRGILDYLMGTKTKESPEKKPLIPRPLPLKDTSQVRSQVEKNHYAIRNQINDAFMEGKINETERMALVNILDPPLRFFDDSVRPTMELYKNQNAAMEALTERLSKKGSGLNGSDYVVQSVIFKKNKYSATEARKWLKDNKYKAPKVDETENMLRFRQMSPSVVDKKGYTEYRTKPLGKSGIELVLAYKGRIQGGSGRRPQPDMPPSSDEEEAPPSPPPPLPPQVQAPANIPEDVIYEILTFLPRQNQAPNEYIRFFLNSRATQYDALDRLERVLDNLPAPVDVREQRRLRLLIASLRRRLAAPPPSPIKKPELPRKRDDEGDDEGGFNPPKIQRTATAGRGMRKNYTGGSGISSKTKYTILELFKGTGSVGKMATKLGMTDVSLDFEEKYEPDILTDILKWDYKKWANENNFKPDFIWASPPCNTYSPLAYPLKERNPKSAVAYSKRAKIGTQILYKTLEIIEYFKRRNPNLLFVIENPKGMMRNDKKIKKMARDTTTYCAYGDFKRKLTDFFNNVPNGLQLKEVKPCPNPDIIVSVQNLKTIEERYSIPQQLIKAILARMMEEYK